MNTNGYIRLCFPIYVDMFLDRVKTMNDKEKSLNFLLNYLSQHRLIKALAVSLPDEIDEEHLAKYLSFKLNYKSPFIKVKKIAKGTWTRDDDWVA